MVHLVVVYGFQGASTDPEKLRLTEKLLVAVLCKLAVVASGQPCFIVGDLNIEPEKILCLLKGFMAGHWFDLQSSWAAASGGALLLPAPGLLVLVVGPAEGGERGVCTCLSPSLLLRQSGVRFSRIAGFFPIALSVASFSVGRWSARVCLPVGFSALWPASWVACFDRSRSSQFAEVRRVWEVYDESLLTVHPALWEGVRSALLAGDVSSAWSIWSFSAEVSLVSCLCRCWCSCSRGWFSAGRWCCSV